MVYLTLQSCQQPHGNSPGSEYMPDMAHSIAYEANYYSYYYNNRWGGEDSYYEYAQPRLPVKGSVPRGGSGANVAQKSVPYYYGNTDAERERATAEIVKSPLPITDAGLAHGKELYVVYCGICHGDKADGNGYLVRDDGGVYPVQPAILNSEEFKAASNGRYYHAIMYGKNQMGAYKDKLSHNERWNVIHYIRSLHAKEMGVAYNQMENGLNSIDEPAGEIALMEESHEDHDEAHGSDHGAHDGDHDAHGHDADNHDDDHGHDDEHSHDDNHGEH